MSIYLYEFLYRGRHENSDESPAWHIILASEETDSFGNNLRSEKTFNIHEAEKIGFTLETIISGINTDIMKENERLRITNKEIGDKLEALSKEKEIE